jgi:hypothetical protein
MGPKLSKYSPERQAELKNNPTTIKKFLNLPYDTDEVNDLMKVDPQHGLHGSTGVSSNIVYSILKQELAMDKHTPDVVPEHLRDTVIISDWLCKERLSHTIRDNTKASIETCIPLDKSVWTLGT